ncbi:hypothetical protein OSB04_012866 [Centaurea solstitialis]|uniref:Reverse transcriptase Ty1/copia-type domain-containing protein n=1 Tax=Centaurea solstitialis TaxID=347529 RepID=A0AA38TV82_9ASTR|nr:hypothetical protein OSB04_012866 [Centaurea solstitialis]
MAIDEASPKSPTKSPSNDSLNHETIRASYHPALTVSNIRTFIPITLEIDKVHYSSWAELFKIHARAFQVFDHIQPPRDESVAPELWTRLDAIVLQWIYGTISTDLLHTILEPDSSAQTAWDHLKSIFQDNKNSRAVTLEQQFSRTQQSNFPNVSAYCQSLKMIADQLANVGSPVSNQRLVLQLVAGLSEDYDGVATIIQHSDPLPQFYQARSMLTLEESRKSKQATLSSGAPSALVTQTSDPPVSETQRAPSSSDHHRYSNSSFRGRGRGGRFGRGRRGGRQPARYPQPSPGPDLLGPRPPQAHYSSAQNYYAPTDVESAFHTLTLNQPDEHWYMDTGATNHMTSTPGMLSSFSNNCLFNHVRVGNGSDIPVTGSGSTFLHSTRPLSLSNVLVVPHLIKNLISVRKFTRDNSVSIEFDPNGFFVKDLRTGHILKRCNSQGDLYPMLPTQCSSTPSSFVAVSSTIWHERLGHPAFPILTKISHLISSSSRISSKFPCSSFPKSPSINVPLTNPSSSSTPNPNTTSPDPSFQPINSPPHHVLTYDSSSTTFQPTNQPVDQPSLSQVPLSSHHMTTRSKMGITKPNPRYALTSSTVPVSPIPKSHLFALTDPNWKAAMLDEYEALIRNTTWELVPRPSNANIIRCMWIFTHKFRSDGSLERYKARLVANGRSQQVGLDCDDTFCPVVKPATIRTFLSIALSKKWSIHQLDVKNAFLHGTLNETVFMHQPPGLRDERFPNHVCRLKKSLYGLKQAPRAWYHRFASFISTIGFHHSRCDNSLFIYCNGDDVAYLLLYVDDILLTTSSEIFRQVIISKLSKEFAMKDLGPLNYFLGISVTHHASGLFLSQKKYAAEIIARAKMSSCNPTSTPLDTGSKLSASSGLPVQDPTLYRSLAGALQYLTFTRPDISYAVQQVCLFMHDPREPHMQALRRILRYLQGTLHLGLHLHRSTTTGLIAYTDADWGGCPDTRRSTSGYCVFLGDNLLSWSSKRQPTLSRSSAEAEYRAVANVVSDTCWIRNLLLELRCTSTTATLVYCDNVSAVYLSGNPVQHQRTKHIEIDIHFVREKVALGQVRVLHVPSRFQYADIFTKGLPRVLFEDFRSSLNIHGPPSFDCGGVLAKDISDRNNHILDRRKLNPI